MTRLLEHPRPWLEHEPVGSTIRRVAFMQQLLTH